MTQIDRDGEWVAAAAAGLHRMKGPLWEGAGKNRHFGTDF